LSSVFYHWHINDIAINIEGDVLAYLFATAFKYEIAA
jgi:hypothetical protein